MDSPDQASQQLPGVGFEAAGGLELECALESALASLTSPRLVHALPNQHHAQELRGASSV